MTMLKNGYDKMIRFTNGLDVTGAFHALMLRVPLSIVILCLVVWSVWVWLVAIGAFVNTTIMQTETGPTAYPTEAVK